MDALITPVPVPIYYYPLKPPRRAGVDGRFLPALEQAQEGLAVPPEYPGESSSSMPIALSSVYDKSLDRRAKLCMGVIRLRPGGVTGHKM